MDSCPMDYGPSHAELLRHPLMAVPVPVSGVRQWTEREVMDELPDVKVKMCGAVFTGRLRGRLLNFAICYVVHPKGYEFSNFEVSWKCVAYCLSNNTPISGD